MAIINFLTTPATIAELMALVAALLTVRDKRSGYWRFFILYLVITLSVESAGFYMRTVLRVSNQQLYNFFMLIQALSFAFLFFRFNTNRKIRLRILSGMGIFILFLLGEHLVIFTAAEPLPHREYLWYTRMLLSVLVTVYSCNFYFYILKSEEVLSPLQYPPFWIVTGLFFYYFGSLPMFAFYNSVSVIKFTGNISFYSLVMGCLSCILYGSWIIGFIWKRKQIPSSRPSSSSPLSSR